MSSPVFSEYFIPTVVHFIRHISNAIELSHSERKYQDLIENINEIVISIDTGGIIQYISPQIRICGKTPEYYIKKSVFDLIYPGDRDRILKEFNETMTTGAEFPSEFRIQTDEGEILWFEDFGRINYDDGGNITGLTGILRNITEKKKNEEAIKRLNLAIEQPNDCIVIHRFDGTIYYANKSFLRTFKYSKEDLINERIKVYKSEENHNLYLDWLERIKEKGSWSGEIRSVRKDGTIFHSYMSAQIIYNEKAEPLEILAIMKDMTELNKQKADLEEKNIALKEILSQIEFEKKDIKDDIIRNINKIILPAMNHLKDFDCITNEVKDYIEKIKADLRNITSSLISQNMDIFTKLSPKEFEICNMAKNGMKNKEIAAILKITLQTIEKHNKNIRKKLGISGQKINLRTFLERL